LNMPQLVKNEGFSVHKKRMDLQIQKHHSRVTLDLDRVTKGSFDTCAFF